MAPPRDLRRVPAGSRALAALVEAARIGLLAVLLGLGIALLVRLRHPPSGTSASAAPEGHASSAILPDSAEPGLPPWRTRDLTWLAARTGADPSSLFASVNRPSWLGERVRIDDGVWVSEALPPAKPDGEVWIGTFGGSSVEGGVGRDSAGREMVTSWPLDLEERLRARGLAVRVLNYGFGGTGSRQALWRFEHEALARGIDAAIFYTGFNDAQQCDRMFRAETLAALREHMRTGDPGTLDGLDGWFARNAERMRPMRAETLAGLPEAELAEALSSPDRFRDLMVRAEGMRRRALGRRIAEHPELLGERNLHGLDSALVAAHPFHDVGRVDALAEESETIRNLRRAIELARTHGVAVGIVGIPTGYRFRSGEPGTCTEFRLSAEAVHAYVEGALNPWQLELATREGLPSADLQAVLHAEPDPGALFHDIVHLTPRGKDVAIERALEPLALELLEAARSTP